MIGFARFVLYLLSQTNYNLFFAFMSVLSQSFFTLVRRHFVSFFLLSAWHSFKFLWVNTKIVYYFFTDNVNVLAGLNAGILCSGMMIVVFFEMLRAVFWALFFTTKLPKPRRYTFSSFDKEVFTVSIKASRVVSTVTLSMPVFFVISFTISALVISLIIIVILTHLIFWTANI
ncbi:membrane protein [gut metagenome]|uniref:Membrane protein n=1 Tax=gut metagenome TaxID=749906 RepID=J9CB95_9ZZZZ